MLSVILITKNEADNIVDCLASVAWADEIIVFDSGSEDETVSICREYTDKVYETDWPGFGIQKQRALNKAKGDWVLSIDADEIVTAELRVEIVKAIQQEKFQGFEIPRLSTYCGKQIRHAGWWPDHVLRLFRRECGYFTEASVHERITAVFTIEQVRFLDGALFERGRHQKGFEGGAGIETVGDRLVLPGLGTDG